MLNKNELKNTHRAIVTTQSPSALTSCTILLTIFSPDSGATHESCSISAPKRSVETAIALLKKNVKPAQDPTATPKAIQELIKKLDADEFDVRQSVELKLTKLGSVVAPEIKNALKGKLTLEMQALGADPAKGGSQEAQHRRATPSSNRGDSRAHREQGSSSFVGNVGEGKQGGCSHQGCQALLGTASQEIEAPMSVRKIIPFACILLISLGGSFAALGLGCWLIDERVDHPANAFLSIGFGLVILGLLSLFQPIIDAWIVKAQERTNSPNNN